jgi:acyl carrier protein
VERTWFNWLADGFRLARLRKMLEAGDSHLLAVRGVPNSRLVREVAAQHLMRDGKGPKTVGELRKLLEQKLENDGAGVDPEQLWQLGDELGWQVQVSWSSASSEGAVDAQFRRASAEGSGEPMPGFPGDFASGQESAQTHANDPLSRMLRRELVPQLRNYLNQHLPDYMMPGHLLLLDEFPMLPNGKPDLMSFPSPDQTWAQKGNQHVDPRTPIEGRVAEIWREVLGLKQVGIHDNFFDLGGHSLLATQVTSRISQMFGVAVPVRTFFESPTVAELARQIEQMLVEKINELTEEEASRLLAGKPDPGRSVP